MLKNRVTIGLLIILLMAALIYSFFILNDIRKRHPSKAKLVITAEVLIDEAKRNLYPVQGESDGS